MIVQFKTATISLPPGQVTATLASALLPVQLREQLRSLGIRELRKVFRRFTPADTVRTLANGDRVRTPDLSQVFLLRLDGALGVPEVVHLLAGNDAVIYAEPNYYLWANLSANGGYGAHDSVRPATAVASQTPADPLFANQWALRPASQFGIGAEAAWAIETGSPSIRIGILDTGIDFGHPDFGGSMGPGMKVVAGYDYWNDTPNPIDDHYHGTHVAGIAGAWTHNINHTGAREGIAGVAGGWGYDVRDGSGNLGPRLVALKMKNLYAMTNVAVASEAMVDAADPNGFDTHVLNASWGFTQNSMTLRSAVNFVARMQKVLVAAKDRINTDDPIYPADLDAPWVIAVGATNPDGERAQHPDAGWYAGQGSNFGLGIDVVAPGTAIVSTMPTSVTDAMLELGFFTLYAGTADPGDGPPISGTSQAAPHVSGLAALLLSRDPMLHPQDVEGIIKASAEDHGRGYHPEYGHGIINAGRALQMMQAPWSLDRYIAYGGTISSSTGFYTKTFMPTGGPLAPGTYIVRRHEVRRTVTLPRIYSEAPHVWGRGAVASGGWGLESPNFQTGYTGVVSSDASSATLRTHVYEVSTIAGQFLGWYPTTPSSARFAYSVLGRDGVDRLSVTISGDGQLQPFTTGNWTATASGGTSGNYTFRWYRNSALQRTHTTASNTDQFSTWSGSESFTVRVEVDRGSETAWADMEVIVWDPGCPDPSQPCLVVDRDQAPSNFELYGHHPNPAISTASVRFAVPETADVRIVVVDVLGREVLRTGSQRFAPGFHEKTLDVSALPSGTYIYRFEAAGDNVHRFAETRRMTIVR